MDGTPGLVGSWANMKTNQIRYQNKATKDLTMSSRSRGGRCGRAKGCRRTTWQRRITPTMADQWWSDLSAMERSVFCWSIWALKEANSREAVIVARTVREWDELLNGQQ